MDQKKPNREFYAKRKGSRDITLFVLVCILAVFGLIMLYSTSAYNGYVKFGDAGYYFKKQLFATTLGVAVMLAVSQIDYRIFRNLAVPAYIISLILSALVLVIGDEYNGSKRWLSLGPFSFQPSEFVKVALILFLAHLVTKNVKNIGKLGTLLKIMFVMG